MLALASQTEMDDLVPLHSGLPASPLTGCKPSVSSPIGPLSVRTQAATVPASLHQVGSAGFRLMPPLSPSP
jgi:hypothetical protein